MQHSNWASVAPHTLVIVPTAGRVPPELVPFTQSRHSAMIRLQRKPVVYWSMEYLLKVGFRHYAFAVERLHNVVQAFVEHLAGWRSQLYFARPDADRGVAYSILCALRESLSSGFRPRHVLVVLGDTYFQFPEDAIATSGSFLLTAPFDPRQDEAQDWCLVGEGVGGCVYRNKLPAPKSGDWAIVAGVYYFSDAQLLHGILESQSLESTSWELHTVLEAYAQKSPLAQINCGDWYDCGHLANLMRSEEKLVKERAFNSIQLDRLCGVLTKRSTYTSKLKDEIAYYGALPEDLRVLFPRLYEVDPEGAWLKMEFYGYPSLSDCFVFDLIHPSLWLQVFRKLRDFLELFRKHTTSRPKSEIETLARQMYLEKTQKRLQELREQDPFWASLLEDSTLRINGLRPRPLSDLLRLVEAELPQLARAEDYSVIHGDLCFSNILYDFPTSTCRLIDPRGSFGEPGIFGDLKYDVAKLSHSVRGSYDFIINDLFFVDLKGNNINFRVYNHNSKVKDIFDAVFFGDGFFYPKETAIIEGLLFLSMLPLHTESRERQLAMFATGLELLNSVFEEATV